MKKIKLYNRDKADLWLEQEDNSSIWKLKVDSDHGYVLKYMRIIGFPEIEAIDPSGGPFISVGDRVGNNYIIEKIINSVTLKLTEIDGNN